MAEPAGNTGIIDNGSIWPVAVLKKDNYKPWSLKLKHALKIIKSLEVVIGTEAMPLLLQRQMRLQQKLFQPWRYVPTGTSDMRALLLFSSCRLVTKNL